MLVYEIHIRWEKRKALARAGSVYPSPLPSFGMMTWILFPFSTINQLRDITLARRAALVSAANVVVADFARETSRVRNTRERVAEPVQPVEPAAEADAEVAGPEVIREHRERRNTAPSRPAATAPAATGAHSPVKHIREWAWAQPEYRDRVGRHARIHADIKEAYYAAHPDERSGL
jgi:hypothetical protein